jgi:transitional endoplasmic reticulum ATPase
MKKRYLKDKDQIIELQVKDAKKRDYGRNIVRIDRKTMEQMKVQTGDLIEITGKKQSVGIAWPSYAQDEGLGVIRIDPRIKENTGCKIGDIVEIRKADAQPAKSIVLSPINMSIKSNPKFETFVKRKLNNYPATIDDYIYISIGINREIVFKVIALEPQGICTIRNTTELTIGKVIIHREKEVVKFEQIGGLNKAIQEINEIIKLHLIQSTFKEKIGTIAPKGIILHGKPGTGKTLLAKAIAYESGVSFLSVDFKAPLKSLERNVSDRINYSFQQAKELKPSILFIDHLDAVAPKIEKVVGKKEHIICSELLSLIDGINSEDKVLIIGATNKPELLEPALLRSGRLNYLIELKLPNLEARAKIFQIHSSTIPMEENVSIEDLAKASEAFTGADISAVCREAKRLAIKRIIPTLPNIDPIKIDTELNAIDPNLLNKILVTQADFEEAIRIVSHFKRESEKLLKDG